MKFYCGVGARKTPHNILQLMTKIAEKLRLEGYSLRSGGAEGADTAFEKGAGRQKEIFYGWNATQEAIDLAMSFHSAPQYCSDIAKKLHGRNSFQVLGANLNDPVKFVICWTPDGCLSHSTRTRASGGTGTAISIASANNIPIFNLQRKEHFDRLNNWTNK